MYSFTTNTNPQTLIILDSLNNFAFKYDLPTKNMIITYQAGIDFLYNPGGGNQFRLDFFGKWLPVSISMYRSVSPNIFPLMSSSSINYQLLGRNNPVFNSYVVREITFSNTFIGLISDFKVFNSFTINPWGMYKK